tara:strand:+ start:1056 stop:1322 length:267 start_codon:yes stop_codon:yes gene_type:complete
VIQLQNVFTSTKIFKLSKFATSSVLQKIGWMVAGVWRSHTDQNKKKRNLDQTHLAEPMDHQSVVVHISPLAAALYVLWRQSRYFVFCG